jgi:hypothetical protein
MCWTTEKPEFDSGHGQEMLSFSTALGVTLRIIQLPLKRKTGDLSSGRSGRSMKIPNHLHPVLRSSIPEGIFPVPVGLYSLLLRHVQTQLSRCLTIRNVHT